MKKKSYCKNPYNQSKRQLGVPKCTFFVEFLKYYYVPSKSAAIENGCQPIVLKDELMKANHVNGQFFKIVPVMSLKEKIKQRKVMIIAISRTQCCLAC